jgi:class 3 adenylate cyclase
MYERMAALQEPRRCQGAILFADLQGSARLSRTLPTATYFSLIRSLSTAMDAAIAANEGVVGKHAGDGVSGFFLLPDNSSVSSVAASSIKAARSIQAHASEEMARLAQETGIDATYHGMNVGLHWGASIYMGQLVPGGRLDVTALGDSVNECARIQETAGEGALLASKQLVEHLTVSDAEELEVDLDKLVYRTIDEIPGVSDKAKRDAGGIPVARIGHGKAPTS